MADNLTTTMTVSTVPSGSKIATFVDTGDGHVQRVVIAGPDEWVANDNQSTAQTDTALQAAPGASLSLYVSSVVMSTDTAMNIKLIEDTAGAATVAGPYHFAANGGLAFTFTPAIKLTANKNLGYTSTEAGNHTVTVTGYTAA